MKVVHVNAEAQRNACLARLCAEVYGQDAGLTPLVVFTGTCSVFFHKKRRVCLRPLMAMVSR